MFTWTKYIQKNPVYKKVKAKDIFYLVDYITDEDSAAYLWEIYTLFTT